MTDSAAMILDEAISIMRIHGLETKRENLVNHIKTALESKATLVRLRIKCGEEHGN